MIRQRNQDSAAVEISGAAFCAVICAASIMASLSVRLANGITDFFVGSVKNKSS